MEKQAKDLYEKMTDTKWYGIVLLAAGSFFYLGAILPTASSKAMDTVGMSVASLVFLAGSVLSFFKSRDFREKLIDLEDGEEYFN